MSDKVAKLERELAELRARYETLLLAFEKVAAGGGLPSGRPEAVAGVDMATWQAILGLTGRQHVALQMMLGAASNAEIAERLGVTESTAKVHVRALFNKLGVRTRSEFLLKVKPVWDRMPGLEYERASGLPKDWHEKCGRHDPWRHVYGG